MRVTLTAEAVQLLERLSGLAAESKLAYSRWDPDTMAVDPFAPLVSVDQFEFNSMVIAALERLDDRVGNNEP